MTQSTTTGKPTTITLDGNMLDIPLDADGTAAVIEPPPITIERIDADRIDWSALAHRLVIHWVDSVECSDFYLVAGTADPAAALKAEIADFDYSDIESTDWSNTVSCYRIKSISEIVADGWADDDDEAADLLGSTDTTDMDCWLDCLATETLTIQPSEPPCYGKSGRRKKAHKWIDGQPRGNGGGVRYEDECRRCGIQRHTDTWATNPCDGSQGHTSTAYYEADGITRMLRPAVIEEQ